MISTSSYRPFFGFNKNKKEKAYSPHANFHESNLEDVL